MAAIQIAAQRVAMAAASAASSGSRAPTDCPTRAVAAMANPKPGKKDSERTLKAMRWEARAAVPSVATIAVIEVNAAEVRSCSNAAGTPIRNTEEATLISGSQLLRPEMETPLRPRHITITRRIAASRRERKVPQALPTAPRPGSPATPKISPYVKKTFTTLASAVTRIGVCESPRAAQGASADHQNDQHDDGGHRDLQILLANEGNVGLHAEEPDHRSCQDKPCHGKW